jgi:hypothetical protein
MSLTDGDVALLARQAVDLLDPDIEISIEPEDPVDPYRFGHQAWLVQPVLDAHRRFGARIQSTDSPVAALGLLLEHLAEHSGASELFRGRLFPPCPGHDHPADIEVEDQEVVLRCPDTGEAVARIRPALPT